MRLIGEEYSEEKFGGMLLLQYTILNDGKPRKRAKNRKRSEEDETADGKKEEKEEKEEEMELDLERCRRFFEDGVIKDWSTCDWFSIRVLGRYIKLRGASIGRSIADWADSENLWCRRAAGISFINLAKNGDENWEGFCKLVLGVCEKTVKCEERFAQTGTGWVVRELGVAERKMAVEFLERNVGIMSKEGVRYATEKMGDGERKRLLKLWEEEKR